MHLKDLKQKSPAELVKMAEDFGVEGASTLRKQDLLFGILKAESDEGEQIMGMGTMALGITCFLWWLYFDDVAGSRVKPLCSYIAATRTASTSWIMGRL